MKDKNCALYANPKLQHWLYVSIQKVPNNKDQKFMFLCIINIKGYI